MGASFIISTASTSFLFLVRIRAIFDGSRRVTLFFTLLWLAILTISILIIFSVETSHIFPTKYCTFKFSNPMGYPVWSMVTLTAFDTLNFLFVSRRLLGRLSVLSADEDDVPWWTRLRAIFTGEFLPNLSRSLFRGGERYYLGTLFFDIVVLVGAFAERPVSFGTSEFSLALIFSAIVVKNILACRLFRQTLLNVSSIHRFHDELENHDPVELQHDLFLSDMLSKRGIGHSARLRLATLGSEGMESVVRTPELAVVSRRI